MIRPSWYVEQKTPASCGVACLAMALRCSHDQAEDLLPERDWWSKGCYGTYPSEIQHVLWQHGVPSFCAIVSDPKHLHPSHWARERIMQHVVRFPAMVNIMIPFKRKKAFPHLVYVEAGAIFDPWPADRDDRPIVDLDQEEVSWALILRRPAEIVLDSATIF